MVVIKSDFRTHTVHEASPHRLELRPTSRAWASGLGFVGIGILASLVGIGPKLIRGEAEWPMLFAVLLSLVFIGIGIRFIRHLAIRHSFDLQEGNWWTGSVPPSENPALLQQGKATAISNIHAVQLLGELCLTDTSGTYGRGEVNLVLQDGSRRHLAFFGTHGILEAANRIAAFIAVPLWSEYAAFRAEDPATDQTD